jgi:hypothetical protein
MPVGKQMCLSNRSAEMYQWLIRKLGKCENWGIYQCTNRQFGNGRGEKSFAPCPKLNELFFEMV